MTERYSNGDLAASRELCEAAYRRAELAGDPDAMAEALLGASGLWVQEQRGAVATARLRTRLERALSELDPGSPLAVRVRIRLAAEADYQTGDHTAILDLVAEVSRSGEPVARAEALSLAHHCLLGPGHGALRRDLAADLIGESYRTGRPDDLLMGLLWTTVDQFLDADPHAERQLGELRQLLVQAEHLAVRFVVSSIEVMLAIRAGRFDEAEELAQTCVRRGMAAGDPHATGWYGAHLVAIRWYQGRLAELLPMLDTLAHSPTLSPVDNSYFAALATAAALAGDHHKAMGALARLTGRNMTGRNMTGLAELPRSSSWLVTMHGAVEAAHLLDDVDLSAQAYELLHPYAHLPATGSFGVACFGSVHHALGVASLTIGAADRAAEHLEEAIQRNLAIGHWPAVILSRQRYEQALAQRGQPRTTRTARTALAAPPSPAAPVGPARCTLRGRHWQIEWADRSVLVDGSVGLLHLAVLLANPGTEIPAIELVAGVAGLDRRATRTGTSPQPVLDRAAMQQYRGRLAALDAEIDQLEPAADRHRAERLRTERDWVARQLATAIGIGGRPRRFADSAERARLSASKAIRRAIDRIEAADAHLGAHLRGHVTTGTRCSYRPA